MTTDKDGVKEFIVSIAKDDYAAADKIFPKIVKSAVQSVINNRKPAILNQLNKQAEDVAAKEVTKEANPEGK